MSRPRLQQVLTKVLDNLDAYSKNNDILRRALSGIQTHTLDSSPEKILTGTLSSLEKEGIIPQSSELSEIRAASHEFANNLRVKWKTPGYQYTVEQSGGKNIYRNITESVVYKKEKDAFNKKVTQIVNSDDLLKLVDAGHSLGYGVAETALLFALGTDLHSTIELVGQVKERTRIHALLEKIPYGMLKSGGTAFEFKVQMEIESKAANRSTSAKLNVFGIPEDKFIGLLQNEIKKILQTEDWGAIQGSPSIAEEAGILVTNAFVGKKTKTNGPRTRAKKTLTSIRTDKKYKDTTPYSEGQRPQQQNWLSIMNLINLSLKEAVISNMGEPGLVNRTGTFAGSARVSGVQATRQGLPSFTYTYDKTPYGVFDPRFGALPWATPARDPNPLIEKSIRQVASRLALGRFYLRRE